MKQDSIEEKEKFIRKAHKVATIIKAVIIIVLGILALIFHGNMP